MIGTGTLVNTAAITAGGLAGLLGGSLMSENMRDGLIKVNGAAVIMIGISGVISGMADISSGSLVMNGTLMMVACLSLGTAIKHFTLHASAMRPIAEARAPTPGATC